MRSRTTRSCRFSALSAWHGLGALVYPSRCLICETLLARPLESPVCRDCLDGLPTIGEPFCPRCGLPYTRGVAEGLCGPCRSGTRWFRRARSLLPYVDEVRTSLHFMKFAGRRRLASVLGTRAAGRFLASGDLPSPRVVVPVPLSRRRRRDRGFNQASIVGRAVAKRAGVPMRPRILRKVCERPPQSGLSARQRRDNAAGAYDARLPRSLLGADILLVDDVFTTGATVNAGAQALLRAGAGAVDVLTLARVP